MASRKSNLYDVNPHTRNVGICIEVGRSLVFSNVSCDSSCFRSEVTLLLKEATGQTLPLFKFIEMFEKR